MATVLERPIVSTALPPEQVKGRQSAMAIPTDGYFPDRVEQGRYGPTYPAYADQLRLYDHRYGQARP